MSTPVKRSPYTDLGDGVRICFHPNRTETVREFRPGWRRTRAGARWTLRLRTRFQRVVVLRCPDCKDWAASDVTYCGSWHLEIPPFVVAPEVSS